LTNINKDSVYPYGNLSRDQIERILIIENLQAGVTDDSIKTAFSIYSKV
jgi:hypothetical protein